jgi:hypothetical protein
MSDKWSWHYFIFLVMMMMMMIMMMLMMGVWVGVTFYQSVAFGLYMMPLNFMWEKLLGVHQSPYIYRVLARLPVGLLLWFLALAFPFFGPLNSMIGALFMSFSTFIIPCVAYIITFWTPKSRQVPYLYYYLLSFCYTTSIALDGTINIIFAT